MKSASHALLRVYWLAWIAATTGLCQSDSMAAASTATNALVQYHSRTWQMDEGLPQDSIQALAQSREGYIWLGTFRGLARFDGVRFQTFDPQNTLALKSPSITALLAANDGSMWIGTAGGLAR